MLFRSAPSVLRVRLAEGDLSSVDVRQVWPRSVDQVHKLVATKASEARDRFNEIRIDVMPRSRAVRTASRLMSTPNSLQPADASAGR